MKNIDYPAFVSVHDAIVEKIEQIAKLPSIHDRGNGLVYRIEFDDKVILVTFDCKHPQCGEGYEYMSIKVEDLNKPLSYFEDMFKSEIIARK